MNRKIFVFIVLILMAALVVSCGLEKIIAGVEGPLLSNITLTSYTVDPGDTVRASIEVEEANGEELSYSWSANGGTVIPPVDRGFVDWKVPIESGTYTITVEVTNEHETSTKSENVIVRDLPEPLAPELGSIALSAYEVDPEDTVTATVQVNRPGQGTLHYVWSVSGGRVIPPTDQEQVTWALPKFGGQYIIEVEVSNAFKSSTADQQITVRSLERPKVEIISPEDGDHFVQFTTIPVQVRASHQNGIADVSLYVNNVFQSTLGGQASNDDYQFEVDLDQSAGEVSIRAEATAHFSIETGMDSVLVITEGVVLGKEKSP